MQTKCLDPKFNFPGSADFRLRLIKWYLKRVWTSNVLHKRQMIVFCNSFMNRMTFDQDTVFLQSWRISCCIQLCHIRRWNWIYELADGSAAFWCEQISKQPVNLLFSRERRKLHFRETWKLDHPAVSGRCSSDNIFSRLWMQLCSAARQTSLFIFSKALQHAAE